jgi:hypothetical protein
MSEKQDKEVATVDVRERMAAIRPLANIVATQCQNVATKMLVEGVKSGALTTNDGQSWSTLDAGLLFGAVAGVMLAAARVNGCMVVAAAGDEESADAYEAWTEVAFQVAHDAALELARMGRGIRVEVTEPGWEAKAVRDAAAFDTRGTA